MTFNVSRFSPDVREFLSLDNPKNAPVQDDDIDDTDEKVDEIVRDYVIPLLVSFPKYLLLKDFSPLAPRPLGI